MDVQTIIFLIFGMLLMALIGVMVGICIKSGSERQESKKPKEEKSKSKETPEGIASLLSNYNDMINNESFGDLMGLYGDVNIGQLPDGAMRVPKQYFGFTDEQSKIPHNRFFFKDTKTIYYDIEGNRYEATLDKEDKYDTKTGMIVCLMKALGLSHRDIDVKLQLISSKEPIKNKKSK